MRDLRGRIRLEEKVRRTGVLYLRAERIGKDLES